MKGKKHKPEQIIKKLRGFDPRVFPWNHHRRTLDVEYHRIQWAAGIHLDCAGDHEHTDTCRFYGFHAIRYGFATLNEGRMTDRELQEQMGHASFETTKRYIKHAQQQRQKDLDVFVPAALKAGVAG